MTIYPWTEQRCYKCEQVKPLPDFLTLTKRNTTFRAHTCSDCRAKRSTEIETLWFRRLLAHANRFSNKGLPTTLTIQEWMVILKASKGCCHYCKAKVGYKLLTIDHVIPLTKSGSHTKDNVVAACFTCNVRKHDRDLTTWLNELR